MSIVRVDCCMGRPIVCVYLSVSLNLYISLPPPLSPLLLYLSLSSPLLSPLSLSLFLPPPPFLFFVATLLSVVTY